MGVHVQAMLTMQSRGAVTFDYGNNIRAQAVKAGSKAAGVVIDDAAVTPRYVTGLAAKSTSAPTPSVSALSIVAPAALKVADAAPSHASEAREAEPAPGRAHPRG